MIASLGVLAQPLPVDPEPIARPGVDWLALTPVIILATAAMVLLLVASFVRDRDLVTTVSTAVTSLAGVGVVVAAVPLWRQVRDPARGPFSTLEGTVGVDGFSLFAAVVIAVSLVLAALLLHSYLPREGLQGVEAYVLLLLSAVGGLVMAHANDLIVLFLGLETLSIAVYVAAALHRRRITSQEAGVKYLVLGAFSSAFFLYGIAMIYGATGTTNLVRISELLSTSAPAEDGLILVGLALLLVGFGFKVAAVPFHFWTPDVYQGSPTPIVAWMASGVKVAGFVGLLRVFVVAFQTYAVDWQPIVFALAVATLVVGSFAAIVQTNVKRMLAYSSIAHAGYVLIGVQAATQQGVEASLFYLATYAVMIAGTFGVATLIGRTGDGHHSLDDYRGLGRTRPGLAMVFAVLLFAQAGVPLTSGFFAKWFVISAAIDAGSVGLAVVGMLAAVVAAFLYLRIVTGMYMDGDVAADEERLRIPATASVTLGVSFVVTVVVGFWPQWLTELARDAVPVLTGLG